MSTQITNILRLADEFGKHLNITHWAVSMRLSGKGNFLDKLMNGGDTHTKTADRVLRWFSDNWPADLEWPADVPRPQANNEAVA